MRVRATRSTPAYDDFLPRLGFVTGLLFTFVRFAQLVPIVMLETCR